MNCAANVLPYDAAFNNKVSENRTVLTIRIDRAKAAAIIGKGAWSLYRNLVLTRDREGLVRYRIATLVEKLAEWWSKLKTPPLAKAPSKRTVQRWMHRLQLLGLVRVVGRTSGGCQLREVVGKLTGTRGLVISEASAAALHRVEEARLSGQLSPRVSPRLSPPAETPHAMMASDGVVGGQIRGTSTAVGVEGSGGSSFPQEGKGEALRTSRGSSPPPAGDDPITRGPAFPAGVDKLLAISPLTPKIQTHDTRGQKITKMICAYRAAVHEYTGKPCSLHTRGVNVRKSVWLVKMADLLHKLGLSPWAFASRMVAIKRAMDREEGNDFKFPAIEWVFSEKLIRKYASGLKSSPTSSYYNPGLYKLREHPASTKAQKFAGIIRAKLVRYVRSGKGTQSGLEEMERELHAMWEDEVFPNAERELKLAARAITYDLEKGRYTK